MTEGLPDAERQARVSLDIRLGEATHSARKLTELIGKEHGHGSQYETLRGLWGSLSGLAKSYQAEFIGKRAGHK